MSPLVLLVSLVLAQLPSYEFDDERWRELGSMDMGHAATITLAMLASLVVGVILAVYIIKHVLKAPMLNRIVLQTAFQPPVEMAHGYTAAAPAAPAVAAGEVGVATSDLRPSGLALFGDRRVDVVSQGDFIAAGTRVRVIEVSGNRVMVESVERGDE